MAEPPGDDRGAAGAAEQRHADDADPGRDPTGSDVNVSDVLRANLTDRNTLVDSSLPTVAFLVAYLVSGSQLQPALVAAVAAGAVIALLRAIRKESLRHVLSGFLGVAIAAWIASQTGRAQDFFLPGLLLNLAYAAVFAGSALIRRPLVGIGIQFMTQDGGTWRQFPLLRSAAFRATWLWAGLFAVRVAVQVPLYLAGAVGLLGTAKLVLGFPLFVAGAFLTHRILSPALAARRRADEEGSGARSHDATPGGGQPGAGSG